MKAEKQTTKYNPVTFPLVYIYTRKSWQHDINEPRVEQ